MTELLQKNNSCNNERRNLRGTLYSGIYDRHRQALFALGSFLRMLRNKKSSDNEVSPESVPPTDEPVIKKMDHEEN